MQKKSNMKQVLVKKYGVGKPIFTTTKANIVKISRGKK